MPRQTPEERAQQQHDDAVQRFAKQEATKDDRKFAADQGLCAKGLAPEPNNRNLLPQEQCEIVQGVEQQGLRKQHKAEVRDKADDKEIKKLTEAANIFAKTLSECNKGTKSQTVCEAAEGLLGDLTTLPKPRQEETINTPGIPSR